MKKIIMEDGREIEISDDMSSHSWAEIAYIIKAGKAPASWVGQAKTDVGTDGVERTIRFWGTSETPNAKTKKEEL